jgi:hypothetical protein
MNSKQFFLTAFAVAAMITASMSTLLAENRDSFTLKYKDTERFHYSIADSTDTTDSGGINIPPIGH